MGNNMWRDVTSYAMGQKGNIEPRSWEYILPGKHRLRVHRHTWYGDEWLLTCEHLDIGKMQLGTTDVEEARKKAITISCEKLRLLSLLYKREWEELLEDIKDGATVVDSKSLEKTNDQ